MRIDRNTMLGSIVPIGLVAAFVVGLWIPHQRSASAMREEINGQTLRLRDLLDTTAVDAPDPAALLRSADPDLDVAVPTKLDLGPLLTSLGEHIKAESIEVLQFESNAVVEGGDFNRIPIRLQCRSTYQALFNLLVRIESSRRIVRIDRIDVNRSADEDEPDEFLSVEITMSAFSRADEENAP